MVVETACSTSFVLYFNPSLRHWWVASILLAHCCAILDIQARQLGLKGPRLASIDLNAIFHILTDCPPITIPANKPSAQNQSPPSKSVQRKAKRKCQKETSLKSRLIPTKIDQDSSSASSASLSGLTISLSSLSGLTISFSSWAPLTFRKGDSLHELENTMIIISMRRR